VEDRCVEIPNFIIYISDLIPRSIFKLDFH